MSKSKIPPAGIPLAGRRPARYALGALAALRDWAGTFPDDDDEDGRRRRGRDH